MNDQLVTLHGRKATTTSLTVSEVFNKQHSKVIRSIEELLSDPSVSRRAIFGESSYHNEQNKKQPMYEMSRDGFSLLVMGFTGKKALEWKLKYMDAFNAMEQALLNQNNLSWQESRANGKISRRSEADTISGFVHYAISQGSQNASKYFMSITNMTYKSLFFVREASPKPFRDLLDAMQLTLLATAECVIEAALQDGMKQNMHYKDIYQLARDRVVSLAQQLPQHRLKVKPMQSMLFG